jgi:hypothetical protein
MLVDLVDVDRAILARYLGKMDVDRFLAVHGSGVTRTSHGERRAKALRHVL